MSHHVFSDSAMPAAAARGRKPAPATRSRQQLQRERALQLAASPGLPPEQQLTRPPPQEEPRPAVPAGAPAGAPAVTQQLQQKPSEVKPAENHQPAPEEETPPVKELEKQEVALLVWLYIVLCLYALCSTGVFMFRLTAALYMLFHGLVSHCCLCKQEQTKMLYIYLLSSCWLPHQR